MEIKDTEYRISAAVSNVRRDMCNGSSMAEAVEAASYEWHVTIKSILAEYHALVELRTYMASVYTGDPQ